MRELTSRYPGTCAGCGKHFPAGTPILYDKPAAYHVACAQAATTPAPHCVVYADYAPAPGTIIWGRRQDRTEGPLVIVRLQREQADDDNDWTGADRWVFYAYCRDATPEEAAPLLAERAADQQRQQALDQRAAIAHHIQETGERPGGRSKPVLEISQQGYRVHDTHTIYGSGDTFVITPAYIWYVRYNSADGDDWSLSNTDLGIGWRVPYSPELEQELLQLEAILDPEAASRRQPSGIEAYRRYAAGQVSDETWGAPFGVPQAPPSAIWVEIAEKIFAGLDRVGDLWLGLITPEGPSRYGISGYLSSNYAIALRYPSTPARLAEFTAHLPDWADIASIQNTLALPPMPSDKILTEHAKAGRYHLPGDHGHVASDREALWQARVWALPLDRIRCEPGIKLLHTNRESRFTGHPFALWSDGQATLGQCYSQPTAPLPEAASQLLSAALRQERWQGEWRSLLTVEEIVSREQLQHRAVRNRASSQEATLERITIQHRDGHCEDLLRLEEAGGAMGEDGDAWESVCIYRPDDLSAAQNDYAAIFA